MSTDDIIGEQAFYQGLDIYVFDERQGTYRVQVLDGADGFSSTCAGYTPEGIRERALGLAQKYLLKRDGIAPKPGGRITWEPIRIEIEPNPKADR
jgi:hypothetical protein